LPVLSEYLPLFRFAGLVTKSPLPSSFLPDHVGRVWQPAEIMSLFKVFRVISFVAPALQPAPVFIVATVARSSN
jgi:hypothetical protein